MHKHARSPCTMYAQTTPWHTPKHAGCKYELSTFCCFFIFSKPIWYVSQCCFHVRNICGRKGFGDEWWCGQKEQSGMFVYALYNYDDDDDGDDNKGTEIKVYLWSVLFLEYRQSDLFRDSRLSAKWCQTVHLNRKELQRLHAIEV